LGEDRKNLKKQGILVNTEQALQIKPIYLSSNRGCSEKQQMPISSSRFTSVPLLVAASNNNPPIRLGDSNESVKVIQMALIDLGAVMPASTDNGTILGDGIFGQETLREVKKFQTLAGLSADGVVGRQTLDALEKALTVQSTLRHTSDVMKLTMQKRFRR
jgi:murein L,D-transpeptidase YcbB/YkuD